MTTASLVISGFFGMILLAVGIVLMILKVFGYVELEKIGFDDEVYLWLGVGASIIGFVWMSVSFIQAAN